jgi:hypothetical protein
MVLVRGFRFDLLWIEKELLPLLPAWGEVLLASCGIPYIVDYDDATFHQYDLHPNTLVRRVLGEKIDVVMRRAALVIVGNEYLAQRARRLWIWSDTRSPLGRKKDLPVFRLAGSAHQ